MENCWFKDWFDSPYYHLLYNKRDENEAGFFISNLCDKLQLPNGSKIWDIACGKGRHTLAFARKGYLATGTDLSENSINEALQNKEPNVEFYVHDMRQLFRTNYFDCAVNLFTSIGYFKNPKDNFTVFKNVHSALKEGACFVIDFFNADKVKNTLVTDYTEPRGAITFHIQKRINDNVIFKKINFTDKGMKYCYEESVSLLELKDFESFATKSGFKLIQTFGDYALNPFDLNTSDRLILIFKK